MMLIHRTYVSGANITATNIDKATCDMNAIWVQVVQKRLCCPGYGRRSVPITMSDLKAYHDGAWQLYLLSAKEGRNEKQFFFKFALIPAGTRGWSKEKCKTELGWAPKGTFTPTDDEAASEADLEKLLQGAKLREKIDKKKYKNPHVHMAIKMESLTLKETRTLKGYIKKRQEEAQNRAQPTLVFPLPPMGLCRSPAMFVEMSELMAEKT